MVPRILAAGAAALLLVLGGCGRSDDSEATAAPTSPASGTVSSPGAGDDVTPPSAAELDGRTYAATSVEGHELVPGTTLRVGFEKANMVVRAGCNTMTGPYSFDGGTLMWTAPPASTLIGCPDELTAQDQWLAQLFTDGLTASVDQFGANLTSGEVTIQLIPDTSGAS